MAKIDRYRREMLNHLPEREDNTLFKYHKHAVEGVMEDFNAANVKQEFLNGILPNKKEQPSIKEAIENTFMDIIDINWKKCENICRETLDRVMSGILSVDNEARSEDYWSLMKRLNAEYNTEIGESLNSKMQFIRLEHLGRRQDVDIKILMKEILGEVSDKRVLSEDETTETESLLSNSISDVNEQHLEKELKLRMTWGRVLIFGTNWIDCRKKSVDLLTKILDIFQNEMANDKTHPVAVCLDRIVSRNGFDNFPLQFANIVNKDFSCHEVLLTKLTQFLDLVTSRQYLDTFSLEPKDLFFNISTFQTDISARQSDTCRGFEICENIIGRESRGLGERSKLLACTSRPLLHLKDLFRKLSDDGKLSQAGIEGVITDLQQEEIDTLTMISESLRLYEELSCMTNNATNQLLKDIKEWLPKRTRSITEMKKIIEKLNKTTKDVAITHTVSSTVGLVGGVAAIVGLILAPFTFGASLIPSAIIGGVVSGLGAGTAIMAAVAEIVISKGEMEKATTCLEENKVLFEIVSQQLDTSNLNFTILAKYIPPDEQLDTQSTAMRNSLSPFQIDPRIAIDVVRFGSFVGKVVLMPVTRMTFSGTIAVSKAILMPLAHGVAAIGVALDIANLVLASVKLGKGAKLGHSEKLEDVVQQMEEEKFLMEKLLSQNDS